MNFILGIDGGGTKTKTSLYDIQQKKFLNNVQTGGSNWNSVGDEKAKEHIFQGISQNLESQNASKSQVAAVCLCMSGVDRPKDQQKVKEWIQTFFGNHSLQIFIYSDAVAALASCTTGDLFGVIVISGTGMIAFGLNRKGEEIRCGGWGPLLGDTGSGFDIGQQICTQICAAHDKRIPPTLLTKNVLDFLQLNAVEELIDWAYKDKSENPWEKWAKLAPLAAQCARQGDACAQNILENSVKDLSFHLEVVIQRLDLLNSNEIFPVGLCGGNLTHEGSMLAEMLQKNLEGKFGKKVKVCFPVVDPSEAAALVALKKL